MGIISTNKQEELLWKKKRRVENHRRGYICRNGCRERAGEHIANQWD